MAEVSFSLPAKRKRGRPRKDGNIFRPGTLPSPENLTLMKTQRAEVAAYHPTPDSSNAKTQEADKSPKDGVADGMVGSMIYGVIEGSFDAGYFVSVRIGNNTTPFRGVVFQPRKYVPVTAANDVAPQAKMYHRRDISVPVYDDLSQITSGINLQREQVHQQAVQASVCPVLPTMSLSVTPYSVGNHSTFMATEPGMLRTSSCTNMGVGGGGGTSAMPKSPTIGVSSQQSPSVQPAGTSIGMLEQHNAGSRKDIAATMGDMISGSSVKSTGNSFSSAENINQKPEVHDKISLGHSFLANNRHNNSNVELHLDSNVFGVQQEKMICREMDHPREFVHDRQQNPAIELQEMPAVSVPRESDQATMTDMYYSGLRATDVNFPQYLLTDQSQPEKRMEANFHPGDFVGVPRSPNLKLDLSSAIHEKKSLQVEPQGGDKACMETNNYLALNGMKNSNVGYHQALVSGNPLLLPTSPDFMMEKPKSLSDSKAPQETNLELESRCFHGTGAAGDSGNNAVSCPYKLELAAPQSNLNISAAAGKQANMTTYMDFVLSDVVQHSTEPHGQPK